MNGRLQFFGVIALLISSPAIASDRDVVSGNYMLEACSEQEANFSSGMCLGRLSGFEARDNMTGKPAFCRPPKATNKQVTDVYVAYLRDNPGLRHLDWSILLLVALNNTWPCPGRYPVKLLPNVTFEN